MASCGLLTHKKGEWAPWYCCGSGGPGSLIWSQLTLKGWEELGRACYRLVRTPYLAFSAPPRERGNWGGAGSSCNNVAKMQVPAFHSSFTMSMGMGSQFFLWCLVKLAESVCMLKSLSCMQLCAPLDCSPPGSSVHGISWARILEWVFISFSTASSPARDQIHVSCVSCIARGFFNC